jgi:hypothetical protein
MYNRILLMGLVLSLIDCGNINSSKNYSPLSLASRECELQRRPATQTRSMVHDGVPEH